MSAFLSALHRTERLESTNYDRTWPVLTHLSGLLTYLVPLGNVLAPLVIWLTKGKTDPEVEMHSREVLNFQITITIASLVALALVFVLIGFVLVPLVGLTHVLLTLFGAWHASKGELLRYPFSPRWIHPRA